MNRSIVVRDMLRQSQTDHIIAYNSVYVKQRKFVNPLELSVNLKDYDRQSDLSFI